MKKKILFILHLPPPVHGASVMGKYIQESVLINEKFHCDYINLSTSTTLINIGRTGLHKFFVILKLYFKIFLTVLKKKYDLYYMTINTRGGSYYRDIVIVFILKLFGKKVIYHFHNKGIAEQQGNKIDNFLYRFQFKNSRAILLSPKLYSDISKYLPQEKIYYCANGITRLTVLDQNELNLKRLKKPIVELLFLSNMMKEKGVFTLLRACKLISSKGIKFKLIFVGEWVDINETAFNEFISANHLNENVVYSGKKTGGEKAECLENADIFIHPTFNDCFPLVILEAMQYGLPVIASIEGGIPDMVSDNETGYLVEKGNVNELADKIQYLIENSEIRKRMGAASREKFEKLYGLEVFENNICKILNADVKQSKNVVYREEPVIRKEQNLLVSIIVPIYNEEEHIRDAINSLLNQTYSNIEIILINDHSTDNSKQICQSIRDPRVKYFEKIGIPKGRSSSRNLGIRLSKGDIIAFMDGDDICAADRIEIQLNKLLETGINSTICGCWVMKKGLENSLVKMPLYHEKIIKGFYRVYGRMTIVGATIMGHRDIFLRWEYRGKFKYHEDWDLLDRIEQSKMIRFVNVDKPLYTYFIRPKGTKYQKDWVAYNIFMRDCQIRRRKKQVEYDSPEQMYAAIKHTEVFRYLQYKLFQILIKIKRDLRL